MQFLLEKLANDPKAMANVSFDLKSAVAMQITRIVSARVVDFGEDVNLLEFGLPNVVELSSHSRSQLERYALRLNRLINRYEPRLLGAKVLIETRVNPGMPWQLVVTGKLENSIDTETFYFDLPQH